MHGVPIEDTLPKFNIPDKNETPEIKRETQTIHNDYQWRAHEDHGWTYSTTYQHTFNNEGCIGMIVG